MPRSSLFFVLLIFASCSQDFKTTAPYRDISMVQTMLNAGDTAQYINIRKAFSDNNRSAFDMAQEPELSYYDNLLVRLIESDSITIKSEIATTLVEMNKEGYPKEEGLFFTHPNYAYKFKHKLDKDLHYQLVIHHANSGRIDSSALFKVVDGANAGSRVRYDSINFSSTNEESKFELGASFPQNGEYIEGNLRFRYIDSNIVTGAKNRQSLLISFGARLLDDNDKKRRYPIKLTIGTLDIQNTLMVQIGKPGENIVRLMDSCGLWIFVGGKELATLYLNRQQDLFIRSDMSNPMYTNMITKDAYGLISSCIYSGNAQVRIDNQTIDTIINGSVTKSLNFVGRTSD